MDRIIFAAEKLAALVVSQRFMAVVVGMVVILVSVGGIVTGVEASVDETELAGLVASVATQVGAGLLGLVAILTLVNTLIKSVEQRPPSLRRDDYEK